MDSADSHGRRRRRGEAAGAQAEEGLVMSFFVLVF